MSITVDDHGAHPHPTGRLTRFADAAGSSGVHSAYLAAIRDGTTGHRYRVPVARGLTVTVTLTAPGPGRPPYDTHREVESWREFRTVIGDIHASGVTCVLHPDLPREIATATWTRNGHRVRVARPGTPRHAARPRARSRWQALTATPVIAAITEKAGQITLGSVTAAALLAPVPPLTPPIGPDHNHAEDVGAGHDHYPPAPLALPAAFAPPDASPKGPVLPEPAHDATADQTPEPSPIAPVRVEVTHPAPSPRVSPTVSESPRPVEDQDGASSDAPDPSPTSPAPTPEPTSTPSVSAPPPPRSVTPRPERQHRPGRRHGHRHKHGHHHRHRRGR